MASIGSSRETRASRASPESFGEVIRNNSDSVWDLDFITLFKKNYILRCCGLGTIL